MARQTNRPGLLGVGLQTLAHMSNGFRQRTPRRALISTAIDAYQRADDPRRRIMAQTDLALIEVAAGNLDGGLAKLTDALQQSRQDGDIRAQLATLAAMARVYVPLGRAANAHEAVERSIELARRLGDERSSALAACLQVSVALAQCRYDQAEQGGRDALGLLRKVGAAQGTWAGQVHCTLARAYLEVGRLDAARRELLALEAVADRTTHPELAFWVRLGTAWQGRLSRSGEASTAWADEAVVAARVMGEARLEAHALLERATVHEQRKAFGEAAEDFRHAYTMARHASEAPTEGEALGGAAAMMMRLGERAEARRLAEQAADRMALSKRPYQEAVLASRRGEIAWLAGERDKALALLRQGRTRRGRARLAQHVVGDATARPHV